MVGSRKQAVRMAAATENGIRLVATQAAVEGAGQGAADPPAAVAATNPPVTVNTVQDAEGAAAEEDGAVMAAIPVWQQQCAATISVLVVLVVSINSVVVWPTMHGAARGSSSSRPASDSQYSIQGAGGATGETALNTTVEAPVQAQTKASTVAEGGGTGTIR